MFALRVHLEDLSSSSSSSSSSSPSSSSATSIPSGDGSTPTSTTTTAAQSLLRRLQLELGQLGGGLQEALDQGDVPQATRLAVRMKYLTKVGVCLREGGV